MQQDIRYFLHKVHENALQEGGISLSTCCKFKTSERILMKFGMGSQKKYFSNLIVVLIKLIYSYFT
jgi:hypothetical protein